MKSSVLLVGLVLAGSSAFSESVALKPFPEFSAPRAITSGPHDHFFANYFAINAWSPDNRYALVLETDIKDKLPDGAPCTLGVVDTQDGNRFIPVTTTRCWNFQEAAMAHWMPCEKDTFVFNDLRDGRFCAVVMNWRTKAERVYPFPVSAVSEDGTWAVSINYARLFLTRPDYGYAGDGQDPRKGVVFPEDDGLWRVDLRTGESKLIVPTAAVKKMVPKVGPTGMSYLCHTVISKDMKRVYFLSRSVEQSMEGVKRFKGVNWFTTAFTCRADGTEIRRCFPDGWGSSHFNWKPALSERDGRTMVVTCKWLDRVYTHVEFTVGEENYPRQIGGRAMDFDGHCIYTPDGQFVSGDGYWDKNFNRHWKIVRLADNTVRDVGTFFIPEVYRDVYCRCDLHPRWRPDGRQVGFNSVHEGSRQVYVMDVKNGAYGRRQGGDGATTVFISDVHVYPDSYQLERFRRVVDEILKMSPLPKNVVCFGDIAYLSGRVMDYRASRPEFQRLVDAGITLTLGMGNHDRRANFLEVWPEYRNRLLMKDFIVSEVDLGACDLVMLDTLHEPDSPEAEKRGWITDGQFKEKRFAWVKAEMARRTRPFFLAAHHPINEITDGDWKALKDIIMETKTCVGWIHGHDHAWKHSLLGHSRRKWGDSTFKRSLCLPSTGHWGDIGYAVATCADHALRIEYHALDHYFPNPDARNMMDDDLLAEKRGAFMTFRF